MFNLFSGVHLDSLEDFSKATPLHRFHLQSIQKQPTEVFYKKGVLKISQNSKEKQPCQSLFFNKVAGLRSATLLRRDSGTGIFL